MNSQYSPEDIDYIKKNYHYNPQTGDVWRMARGARKGNHSRVVGYADKSGYLILKTGSFEIKMHRVAWLLHYGELPETIIDHIDRNPANNKIDNLRLANQSGNSMNSKKHDNGSKSKYRGVTWSKQRRMWQAYIYKDGKHIHIITSHSEERCAEAYVEKAKQLHPQFFTSGSTLPSDLI